MVKNGYILNVSTNNIASFLDMSPLSSSNYFSYRLYIGAVDGNILHASDSAIFMKYSLVPPFRKNWGKGTQ